MDRCSSDPCQNGATCKDLVDHFDCLCEIGFTGVLCETRMPCSFFFSKLNEKRVYNRLLKYTSKHSILLLIRTVFRNNHDKSMRVLEMLDKITAAIDSNAKSYWNINRFVKSVRRAES